MFLLQITCIYATTQIFSKNFRTEHGFAYYYPQEVIYEGNKEKWLVVPSYFTRGLLENFNL